MAGSAARRLHKRFDGAAPSAALPGTGDESFSRASSTSTWDGGAEAGDESPFRAASTPGDPPAKCGIRWSHDSVGVPIATFRPAAQGGAAPPGNLAALLGEAGRDEIRREYARSGAVILRGFPLRGPVHAEETFRFLVGHRPGGGTLRLLPAWLRSACRNLVAYAMFVLVDSKRGHDMRSLGPAGSNVQGPHQEGSFCSWRHPHVAFHCEVPPAAGEHGETAIYDAGAAYRALPDGVRRVIARYQFTYYMYAGLLHRVLPRWAHTLLAGVSFALYNQAPAWTPLVLRSPAPAADGDTHGDRYLQWFSFGDRLTDIAAETFQEHYPERGPVTGDPSYDASYDGEYMVRLAPAPAAAPGGKEEPSLLSSASSGGGQQRQIFTEEAERAIANAFFARHSLIKWQANDLVLLDNIRWAHGRVNGVANGSRKIQFFQAEPLVLVQQYAAP